MFYFIFFYKKKKRIDIDLSSKNDPNAMICFKIFKQRSK